MKFIKFTLISELPEPYRSLARLRETQPQYDGQNQGEDILIDAFLPGLTPEGNTFWFEVNRGKTPEIPQSSLRELEALK